MYFAFKYEKQLLLFVALAVIFVLSGFFFELAPEEHKAKVTKAREPEKTYAALLRASASGPPALSAEAVFVSRLRTGEVLFAQNEDKNFAPASLAKLMTALLFYENVPALDLVAISKEAKDILENDEKRSHLEAGEAIKAEDMLKLVVAESDNDAAYAAAEAAALRVNPSLKEAVFDTRIHRFVFLMNQRAGALGLKNTHFANPGGKDEPENYSTARDLTSIAKEIWSQTPRIWDISRLIEGEIYYSSDKSYHFENTDILLKEFPAIYGSKTGFTDEAGGALLILYELAPNDAIAVVILKSQERFDDGRAILRWLDASFKIQ